MRSTFALFLGLITFYTRLTAASANYDVITYGGTPAGIAASIHAARDGARTLLIEPTKHVGGLSTSGINTAESEHMLAWTIGGFADEFYRRMARYYEQNKERLT